VTEPGIYELSEDAYHDDPCARPSLSASLVHILCSRTPLHAWAAHRRLNPDFKPVEKTQYDIGKAVHAYLLEGRDAVVIVDAPDWRTKAAREARDQARFDGKIPLLAGSASEIGAMVVAAREQIDELEVAPGLFVDGLPERTLIWEEDGIFCRARLDWLHDDCSAIDDFKTTSASADPERWTRTAFTIGADVQTAFYLRGLRALTGEETRLRYVVQETYQPYALSVVTLGPDVLAVGERKVEWAIRRWRLCLESDSWNSYGTDVHTVALPSWEEARWLEKEAREEIAA
jgi:hypothetical protein